ncbi:hypothetical protein HMPREF9193_01152 [Treponema lecithinolyticum ATCC 700332]|uniref:Secreted protein n=1 Tax=Treponema lecithinolyticum ATCC 700332 TaxID=1321815 RepID=A0ABN0NYQ6_TRELE|nr:hypothetical protein HMPREF9193_01152 [Treponema lecithinolyticum ATCC 700332]
MRFRLHCSVVPKKNQCIFKSFFAFLPICCLCGRVGNDRFKIKMPTVVCIKRNGFFTANAYTDGDKCIKNIV